MSKRATTIAIVNQKGGTGKTTSTENIGVALAMEGKKVLYYAGAVPEWSGKPVLRCECGKFEPYCTDSADCGTGYTCYSYRGKRCGRNIPKASPQ